MRMVQAIYCNSQTSRVLRALKRKLWRFCSRIQCLIRRRPRNKVIIRRFGKLNSKGLPKGDPSVKKSPVHLHGKLGCSNSKIPIRIATFNVAMFSLAPAISSTEELALYRNEKEGCLALKSPVEMKNQAKAASYCPKSILKQSPLHTSLTSPEHLSEQKKVSRSKLKVSINLPDNEISLANSNVLMRSPVCLPTSMMTWMEESAKCSRSIAEVLREVDADILSLQDVKAEEENDMKPLSDLAAALGMKYVFAESWAPEYGNAILSKWPIKRWKVQKIADDKDFRNVLKATVDVPWAGEVNVDSTQLDHLNEKWRMKQICAIIQSNDSPHILAGGLNSLDGSDYSAERWMDIVKYYEDIGKPTPRVEVMKLLKGIEYVDSKEFAGEYVQGTCKYGTRVDYILASPDSPYKFVPGSYSVISSKGTSDHHIVKVDVTKVSENAFRLLQRPKQKVIRMTNPCSTVGVWKLNKKIA
ncbi:Endo/exonuclease/phosphatase domain-containing protein [Citrus sinensis]|uniref:Endo/exonuclease/phosphatase domain-containing protein n=1 Tax=Citrus sinensis TaxID=2711 RepID=A0ACB8I8M8_CITSI|nr:Endo/exonuclease/phosphatase domain-containing protein [Citrus sinensis]